MMASSESAKSFKISTILTPAVLTIVNKSIVNVFNGKIMVFSFKFTLSMKNNSGFQKLLKIAKL
jgi:hypothetical protein